MYSAALADHGGDVHYTAPEYILQVVKVNVFLITAPRALLEECRWPDKHERLARVWFHYKGYGSMNNPTIYSVERILETKYL